MANKEVHIANTIVERQLADSIKKLEETLGADVLIFRGPLGWGAEDVTRDWVESIKDKTDKLVVILTTTGGYIEVVERIVNIFRHHYQAVEFIIPNYALSAGTVLVMSGDAIHMDYYSILGPIDPQVARPDTGDMIPALGYLIQFERLIAKSKQGKLTTAELNFLVENFDAAELYSYEQARDLSTTLLKEWLVRYKFKNWKRTKTRKRKVSDKMRKQRAESIAKKLNNPEKWHSHRRGISMEVLRRDLKLQIEDFGENEDLTEGIRLYHDLLTDYMAKRRLNFAVQTKEQFIGLRT